VPLAKARAQPLRKLPRRHPHPSRYKRVADRRAKMIGRVAAAKKLHTLVYCSGTAKTRARVSAWLPAMRAWPG
jgi:hypothetical protein